MSTAKFGLPYRPPCGGWTKVPSLFLNCHSHFNAGIKYPIYENVTTVGTPPVAPSPTPSCEYYAPPCGIVKPNPCSGDDVQTIIDNCYQKTPAFTTPSQCKSLAGFKNVVAFKQWFGQYPFTNQDFKSDGELEDVAIKMTVPAQTPPTPPDFVQVQTLDPSCAHTPRQANIDTKFLTATLNGMMIYTQARAEQTLTFTSTINCTLTVDKNSGVITRSAYFYQIEEVSSRSPDPIVQADTIDPLLAGLMLQQPPQQNQSFADYYLNRNFINKPPTADGSHGPLNISIGEAEWTYDFNGREDFPNINSETFDTRLIHFSVVLSDSYTLQSGISGNSLNDDHSALLATWDLANDYVYPWRVDELITSAPFVHRDEKADPIGPLFYGIPPAKVSDGMGGMVPWTDPAVTTDTPLTGKIIGAPLTAGYKPFWNKDFKNWIFGFPPGYTGDNPIWYVNSNGAFSPYWCPSATDWTNARDAAGYYPGAWAATANGGLLGCKWAEIYLFAKPSHNFARPCGSKDRCTKDQTTINCVTNPEGSYRFPTAPCDCDDAERQAGPNPPTDCPSKSSGCPETKVADYKWNDSGPKGNFIVTQYFYDYRDIGENARLQQAYLDRVNQNNQRAIDTTPDFPYPPCQILFPVAQVRNGNPLKNIICTDSCVTIHPCAPAVLYCSPNTESFEHGYSFPFNRGVAPDAKYGSRWNLHFLQWMPDPLFQGPACPCGDRTGGQCDYTLKADNGSCGADEPAFDTSTGKPFKYFLVPYEEGLAALPKIGSETAPALPAGLRLGCVNLGTEDAPNWVGPECGELPTGAGLGSPLGRYAPWAYWLRQLNYNCPDDAVIVDVDP